MADIPSEAENAEEMRLGPVFDKDTAQPLSNSQALHLLQQVQSTRKDADPAYVPTPMIKQTQQYLERFNTVKSIPAADAMRQTLADAGVHPFEQCTIINLMPSTAEEAKALVPSLENVGDRFPDEERFQQVLDSMATYKDI